MGSAVEPIDGLRRPIGVELGGISVLRCNENMLGNLERIISGDRVEIPPRTGMSKKSEPQLEKAEGEVRSRRIKDKLRLSK